MALSRIDTTNMIEDVPQSKIDNNINFRNLIINGSMDIAQRGTSESGITGSGYFTCDRWNLQTSSAGTWTQSQSSDVPTGQGFSNSFKMDCTTANASLSAGSYLKVRHKIEGQNLQYIKKGTANAESLTLSFWVKSNKTGTYIVEFEDRDNSRHISQSYTINTANTWEKKILTYAGDTTGTLDNDNTDAINIAWYLLAGTNNTSGTLATSWESIVNANRAVGQVNLADSTSNEWLITGVQLESSETASDFEFLPRAVMESLCYRYYYKPADITMYAQVANQYQSMETRFSVEMRAVPTLTVTYTVGGSAGLYAQQLSARSNQGLFYYNRFSGVGSITGRNTVSNITADAEL